MFRTFPLSIIRSLFTVHSAMVYVIQICRQLSSRSICSFIIKLTRCTNFTNLFWHENLHVSDSSSVHHQEFIHRTLSNDMCHTAVYKPVWHIPLLSVQWINSWWWTEELSETCRFSSRNLHGIDASARQQGCRQLSSRSICSCSKAVYKPIWHVPLLSVSE